MKKFLSFFLVNSLLITMYSQTTPSQPTGWTDGSGGEISNLAELRWLSETSDAWDEAWVLTANINAGETRNWNIIGEDTLGFSPIGNFGSQYSGTFSGNGYSIDGLYINRPDSNYVGLFGYIYNSTVDSLNLTNCNIIGHNYTGGILGFVDLGILRNLTFSGSVHSDNYGGGISGQINSNTVINWCSSTGLIGGASLSEYMGGLVGRVYSSDCIISNSYSLSDVNGYRYCGRLVGQNGYSSKIEFCYSTGDVNAFWSHAGGLVGYNSHTSTISYCFNTGNIYGRVAGGLVGRNWGYCQINNSYSTGYVVPGFTVTENGGLVGSNEYHSLVNLCYFDSSTSQMTQGIGRDLTNEEVTYPLTTAEFNNPLSFEYWDMDDVWEIRAIDSIDLNPRPYFRKFLYDYFLNVEINSNWGGKVKGESYYNTGDAVTLEALPAFGYRFLAWIFDNDTVSKDSSCSFTYTADSSQTWEAIFISDNSFLAGDGSNEFPYQVSTLEHLKYLSVVREIWDSNFVLMNNIDASETRFWNISGDDTLGFSPIGNYYEPFSGTFNGQGFFISNLYINRPDINNIGLFGFTQSCKISNLGVIDANYFGHDIVGTLAGRIQNSDIYYCFGTGVIEGLGQIGGLIGWVGSNSTVKYSYADCDVRGNNGIGGFSGINYQNSLIKYCFSAGSLSGDEIIGGFIGKAVSYSYTENCYSVSLVDKTSSNFGGFAGMCFSQDTILNCFFDTVRAGTQVYIGQNDNNQVVTGLDSLDFSRIAIFQTWFTDTNWVYGLDAKIDSVIRPYFTYQYDYKVNFQANNGILNGIYPQGVNNGSSLFPVEVIPQTGFYFTHWKNSNNDSISAENPIRNIFPLNDLTLIPNILRHTYSLNFASSDHGILHGDSTQIVGYNLHSQPIEAVSDSGYIFVKWTTAGGDSITNNNPLVIQFVTNDTLLIAVFEKETYKVTFMAGDKGSILGNNEQVVNYGESASPVGAIAKDGYHFVEWQNISGVSISTDNPLVITNVISDSTLVAIFEIGVNRLSEAKPNVSISIYPNPAQNELYIYAEKQTEVKIFTISGNLVKTYRMSGKAGTETINIADLQEGIYIVRLMQQNIIITKNLTILK